MMRRLSLAFLVALIAVSCDENPTQPSSSDAQLVEAQFDVRAGNPVVHRLTVGGADAEVYGPPGSDANFSLIALQRADGTVSRSVSVRLLRISLSREQWPGETEVDGREEEEKWVGRRPPADPL